MISIEKILAAVAKNKPAPIPFPDAVAERTESLNLVEQFCAVAVSIGSKVFRVKGFPEIQDIISQQFIGPQRIISGIKALHYEASISSSANPHTLENVDLTVLQGSLAIAENGALRLTEKLIVQRVLLFIFQHLALLVSANDIVAGMHQAYDNIGNDKYDYGLFIAGPSKTAGIEQSLLLGAHGPRSLSLLILLINSDKAG